MNHAEAIKAGLIDPKATQEYADKLRRNALARYTAAELIDELKERANRKVVQINKHVGRL